MAHTITILCVKCSREIRANNWLRHDQSCVGIKKKKIRGVDFDPNSGFSNGSRVAWNKGLTRITNDSLKRASSSLKNRYAIGEIQAQGCYSPDYPIEKRRIAGRKGGGYREGAGRSKKFHVLDSFMNKVCLQSSYEFRFSQVLNMLCIKWIRPKGLIYSLENSNRRYFADFYLVDYDLYIDTKK